MPMLHHDIAKPVAHITFFVLNLLFHIVNTVWRFNLQGDGFASQSFHKNLHGHLGENIHDYILHYRLCTTKVQFPNGFWLKLSE